VRKAAPNTVHQLKTTLRGARPRLWRRIVVRSDIKLSQLAPILESAMGWYGGHLHQFEIGGAYYGDPDPDGDSDDLDERRFVLATVLPNVGSKMRFDYDFGDGWEHDIIVEAIEPAERGVTYPRLIAGKRACPPEDCGDPFGYQNLLEALADPKHPGHDELTEWVGGDFDPDHFDPGEATAAMQSPPLLRGW
jgi:hypothetical protein